jgi:hypothetical protein
VSVGNFHRGAKLQVWRKDPEGKKSPISDFVYAYSWSTIFEIKVTPFLREGDEISVLQWACGDVSSESNKSIVLPHGSITEPKINDRIYSGATQVKVDWVIGGSLVEVYVALSAGSEWRLAGSSIAYSSGYAIVLLNIKLSTGNLVSASQSLCGVTTDRQSFITVMKPMPLLPQLDYPRYGAINVPKKTSLAWHDPGAGTEAQAESFELLIWQGSTTILNTTGIKTTNFPLPSTIKYENKYDWRVTAVNSSGKTASLLSEFTVEKDPTITPPLEVYHNPMSLTLEPDSPYVYIGYVWSGEYFLSGVYMAYKSIDVPKIPLYDVIDQVVFILPKGVTVPVSPGGSLTGPDLEACFTDPPNNKRISIRVYVTKGSKAGWTNVEDDHKKIPVTVVYTDHK